MNSLVIVTLMFFSFSLASGQEGATAPQSVNVCGQFLSHQKEELDYLKNINDVIVNLKNGQSSLENYEQIRSIWMDLTGLVYTIGSFDEDVLKKSMLGSGDKPVESKEYLKCLHQLEASSKRIKTKAFKTFIMASRQRMREIAFQRTLLETPIFNWTDRFFKDNVQEVKVIPLRWIGIFSSKLDRFQSDMELGVEGWIKVSKDLLLLFVFIFSLIGFVIFSLRFHLISSKFQEKILKYLYSNKKYVKWGNRVQKGMPYLPWALLILFVRLEQELIKDTYFSDLNILFPYVTYFAAYKLFRIFVSQVLINFLSFARGYDLSLLKQKVDKSASRLSHFVIWSFVLLHTVESATGRGFVYIWIDKLYILGLVYLFVSESRNWEKEIEDMLKEVLPDRFLSPLIQFSNKLFIFRSMALLIVGIFSYLFVLLADWVKKLEISKTLSARVFRERVKNASVKSDKGAVEKKIGDYERIFQFTQPQLEIKSQVKVINQIEKYVDLKLEKNSVRKNIGIIGDYGLGKTQMLKSLKLKLENKIEYCSFTVGSRDHVDSFFDEIKLRVEGQKQEAVFVVDDFHFLFLSKVGGFEKIKDFFNFIDRSSDLISWIIVINKNSWIYLDSILNKTHYFNLHFFLEKWTEHEIKDLVLAKHKESGYKLSFDNILMAMKSDNFYEDKKYVEEKYFRILWEESLGNPEIAQRMWIESLKASEEDKRLNVGIPHSRFDLVKGLPNEFYFVLASIVRHVEISIDDLAKVNDVDVDYVRNAVEFCEDLGYVLYSGKTVRVAPLWQNNINMTLEGKNYIYGR